MLLRISTLFLIAWAFGAASAADTADTSSLRVDLDAVVRTERVHPVDGITSSGQPDEAALKVFAAQGYTTVIDLRTEGEDRGLDEPAVVRQLGMNYVSLPIGRDSISFDSAKALDKLIANAQGPVLVHCGSGNRVGALLALRKSLAGADDATALEYGREGGMTGLESRVKDILDTD
jgi:uncharacterized protein (TIGR01244 family)